MLGTKNTVSNPEDRLPKEMNSDRSEAESYFSLFSSPMQLPQKEKIKIKNYLCST